MTASGLRTTPDTSTINCKLIAPQNQRLALIGELARKRTARTRLSFSTTLAAPLSSVPMVVNLVPSLETCTSPPLKQTPVIDAREYLDRVDLPGLLERHREVVAVLGRGQPT